MRTKYFTLLVAVCVSVLGACEEGTIPTEGERVASLVATPFAFGTVQSVLACELDLAVFTIESDLNCASERCVEEPSSMHLALDSRLPVGSTVIRNLGAEYTTEGVVLDVPIRVDSCPEDAPLVQVIAGSFDSSLLIKLPGGSEYCSQASQGGTCFPETLIDARVKALF